MQSRDEAILRKRLAEDFIMVHGNGGAIDTRDRFIAYIQSGAPRTGEAMTIAARNVAVFKPSMRYTCFLHKAAIRDSQRLRSSTAVSASYVPRGVTNSAHSSPKIRRKH